MKNFLFRLSLAAGLTVGVIVLGASARAQEPSSQEPAATTPPQQQSPASTPDASAAQDQDRTPSAKPQQQPQEPAATPGQNEPRTPRLSRAAWCAKTAKSC